MHPEAGFVVFLATGAKAFVLLDSGDVRRGGSSTATIEMTARPLIRQHCHFYRSLSRRGKTRITVVSAQAIEDYLCPKGSHIDSMRT